MNDPKLNSASVVSSASVAPRALELLAPARDFEGARAAVDHGADAIYIGASAFGARSAAHNSVSDISRAVAYAHQYGVRVYVTLNTLLFDGELSRAESLARELLGVGVDALIVQDMAYARMELGCELHASTQTTNYDARRVSFLASCGFSRVVLERNLSLDQIRKISRVVGDSTELEAFVHGAVCIGHSGACYLSKAMNGGSRSGNRGDCSQSCRLNFDLEHERGHRLLEGKYLLSAKDLNLSGRLDDLASAGVSSFKIEGRLKDLNYTRNIVSFYRRELDRLIASSGGGYVRSSSGRSIIDFDPSPSKSFSRSESVFLFDGGVKGAVSLDTPKSLGERVGRVVGVRGDRFCLEPIGSKGVSHGVVTLATGDGVCYLSKGDGSLVGSSVNQITVDGDHQRWYRLNRASGLSVGAVVYRNFNRLFESSVEASRTRRVISVSCSVVSSADRFEVTYRDCDGFCGVSHLDGPFELCHDFAKMEGVLVGQLMRCGDTIFELLESAVDLSCWGGEFIASRFLGDLRRDALEALRLARLSGVSSSSRGPFVESLGVLYPGTSLDATIGVTNAVAEAFYRAHGVRHFERSLEFSDRFDGALEAKVMTSSYCIRREIGACLKHDDRRLRGDLFLVRGSHRFRLGFDCGRCLMSLVKV